MTKDVTGGNTAWRDPALWKTDALYERGVGLRERLGSLGMAEDLEELGRFDPLLPHYVLQFQFGEVLSRPGLDLKTRMLCLIAAALMGRRESIAAGAMRAHLDIGGDAREIVEVVVQTGSEGFPIWLEGARIGLEVFRERGLVPEASSGDAGADAWKDPDRWNKEGLYERGAAIRGDLGVTHSAWDQHARLDLLFPHYVQQFRFGELEGRDGLDIKARHLCYFAQFLTAKAEHATEAFLRGALVAGATPQECIEVFLQTGTFFGFSRWTLGSKVCRMVFDDLGLLDG